MVQIVGHYQHEKNENIDEYFRAIGVPYLARKMMSFSSPRLEVSKDDETWTFRTVTMVRTLEMMCKLNEEFTETMPNGAQLKSIAVMEGDNCFVITSTMENGEKTIRRYEFSDEAVLLTLTHEKSGQVAKRHFRRL